MEKELQKQIIEIVNQISNTSVLKFLLQLIKFTYFRYRYLEDNCK